MVVLLPTGLNARQSPAAEVGNISVPRPVWNFDPSRLFWIVAEFDSSRDQGGRGDTGPDGYIGRFHFHSVFSGGLAFFFGGLATIAMYPGFGFVSASTLSPAALRSLVSGYNGSGHNPRSTVRLPEAL